MAPNKLPSAKRLRQLFSYDPSDDAGFLTRKPMPRSAFSGGEAWGVYNRFVGQPIKGAPCEKYIRVTIGYVRFPAHRVIWKMVTGREPREIDHINRNGRDNRWINLRLCTRSENHANVPGGGKHLKGIVFHKGAWVAAIRAHGRQRYLGRFRTEKAAHAAYVAAGRKAFGAFFHAG
jgi:hypothetical protein